MAKTATQGPDRLLGLLGLGRRAGQVVLGRDLVRAALQDGRVVCLVVAEDAGPRVREKVVPLAMARGVPVLDGPPGEVLGARLGRPVTMVAGVLDRALARGLLNRSPGSAPREA